MNKYMTTIYITEKWINFYKYTTYRGTGSTKQTSKQNINREIEIKNRMTVTKWEWGEG